ncbi:MAG: phage portal protein [Clostridia bacterium]|nr:phage portal protein [Clostridia bacterium]
MTKLKDLIRGMTKLVRTSEVEKKVRAGGEVSEKMKEALSLWSLMYDNESPWCNDKVKSLNLPAAIAAEVARLATVEMRSEVSGSARAEFLNKAYQPVLENLRRFVEYGCAKGGMVMKPYVDGNKILVDFIQADKFFPTAFDSSGRITGAIFVGQIKKDGAIYTRLEEHIIENKIYKIVNHAYFSRTKGVLGKEIPLSQVAEWKEISPNVSIKNVDRLLIGYFKVPYANAVDPGSPLGVSVYARACDLICEADRQYSRLLWEFESGERALYVSDMAFRVDKNGRAIIPDKRLYRLLALEQNGDDLFSDWTPNLREENILRGLNSILRKIEFNCGLAYGTLSDIDNVDKTAEEVRASKQRSFSMICDVQKSVAKALEELVYAMDVLCSLYKLAPSGKSSVSFEFDDSSITDRNAEFAEKQQLVQNGIMHPWEFRMWYFGESEEVAKKAVSGRVFKTDAGVA